MPSSLRIDIDVSEAVDLSGPVSIAAEIFEADRARAVLFCFPGGGRNRHYFDLRVPGDSSYSFARSMAGRGFRVVIIDHLGVGDSTRPDDGFDVTPERLIAANACAMAKLQSAFGEPLPAIGVGHSMGAMLLILQQARYADCSALALLGFGHGGLPEMLGEYGRELAEQPATAVARSAELARQMFPSGYYSFPEVEVNSEGSIPAEVIDALAESASDLLTIPGALSLVPGAVREPSRYVDVPVFAAIGDRDICGPFEAQHDLCAGPITAMELKNTRHNHFLYPSRQSLYQSLSAWLISATEQDQTSRRRPDKSVI